MGINGDQLPTMGYSPSASCRDVSWGHNFIMISWIITPDVIIKSHQYPQKISQAMIDIMVIVILYIYTHNVIIFFVHG